MWLAGHQRPDFRTINHFRSKRMKDVLEKVFTAVLQVLIEETQKHEDQEFKDQALPIK
jgi:transposase